MSKLTKQDKIDIYNQWKHFGQSPRSLAKEYSVRRENIDYLVNLIDLHGIRIIDQRYTTYSTEFKQKAINRVLVGNEKGRNVALDLALPSNGLIYNWIRKYKEDGYNVINHKKDKSTHARQRQADQRPSKANKSLKSKEFKAYCRTRIYKKLDALVSERNKDQQHKK